MPGFTSGFSEQSCFSTVMKKKQQLAVWSLESKSVKDFQSGVKDTEWIPPELCGLNAFIAL